MLFTSFVILITSQVNIDWNDTPDQYWIGNDWHANRLQDWSVQDNKVICTETSERLPMRTLHLLTTDTNGIYTAEVRTGTIDSHQEPNPNAWSGFLIGAGSNKIDYRLTSLVHHVPAQDGGYIAGVDHFGHVFLRNNTIPVGGNTNPWSINIKISPSDLPLIEPTTTEGIGFTSNNRNNVRLLVTSTPTQSNPELFEVTITATDALSNKNLSKKQYVLDKKYVDGSIALVSHHGPKGSKLGHWFDDFTFTGDGVTTHSERTLGPVISTLYTLHENTLKMTAQFPPLSGKPNATLQLLNHKEQVPIDTTSWTATFKIPNVVANEDVPYTVILDGHPRKYNGIIQTEPTHDEPITIAALTCHKTYTGNLEWNHNGLWFPQKDIVEAVLVQNPDLLYFSGDQIYEGDLTPARQKNEDAYILDYLYKWMHWCWAFQDLTRNTPCITIPDDHDVYHGNLWGAGERDAQKVDGLTAQDSGGYKHGPRFINAVHRTQTNHLPDPVDPALDAQGNTVYFTRMRYGGVDIAILGDRQFKESPAIAVPEGGVYNGWFKAEGFNPKTQADCDAPLLGTRQEAFLDEWSTDWEDGDWMKFVFSQSPFACLQTLPEGTYGGNQFGLTIYPEGDLAPNDVPAADADSNGWPQTARDRALRMIKQANAVHVCGDQHLGSLMQYGIEEHGDGTYAFCTPAIANAWPRRWMPSGLPITGDHEDGFGNKVTVLAVSNPYQTGKTPVTLHDRAPGWGLLECDPVNKTVTINAWPRWAEPNAPDSDQYNGWPVTLKKIGKIMPAVLGIAPDELQQLLESNLIVLIDVREVNEFETELIPGALNFPLSTFTKEAIANIANGKEVVFHCQSGYRSSLAAKEFFNGEHSIKHLDGGILAWKKNGNKTITQ